MADKISMYGGRATLRMDQWHRYWIDVPALNVKDLRQPSVTGVLDVKSKPALIPWAVNTTIERAKELISGQTQLTRKTVLQLLDATRGEVTARKEEAAGIGTIVHEHLHAVLLGEQPKEFFLQTREEMEQAENAIAAGKEFISKRHIEVVQAESPRWSPTNGFVGTGDLIAHIDGKLSVLDWKTSSRLYATHFLQTAAYQCAYQEEFPGQQIEQRVIVNTGKDGYLTHQTRNNDTFGADLRAFLCLLGAWRWSQDNEPQRVYNRDISGYEFVIKGAPPVLGPLPE